MCLTGHNYVEKNLYNRTKFFTGDAVQEDNAWTLCVLSELSQSLLKARLVSLIAGHEEIKKNFGQAYALLAWHGKRRARNSKKLRKQ